MASLEKRSGKFRVVFRFGGRKFSRALKTRIEKEAIASVARLEDNLRRLELGTLVPPDGADIAAFLLSDGRLNSKPKAQAVRTLSEIFAAYITAVSGRLEQTTLTGIHTRFRHVKKVLGERFPIQSLDLQQLQAYVDTRAKAPGRRGRTLSVKTITLEVTALGTIWNWGVQCGMLNRSFPSRALQLPKTAEKPAFQTWQEIERRIKRGGLTKAEEADLWDRLFLTLPEIGELLEFVKANARHPFIYPMFVFAAHTGARRSEIMNSTLEDIDFGANTVTIHEKKRVRGTLTTRRVPMSPTLQTVLQQWLDGHPGGNYTFCRRRNARSKVKGMADQYPLTSAAAHFYFKDLLVGSKWVKLRGWHVFRHSFCSNCAAAGIDQRIINGWVGHQTEEMVRRYRHLLPDQQQSAIVTVFGAGQQPVVAHAG